MEDLLRLMALAAIFSFLTLGLLWKMGRMQKELDEYRNAKADTVFVVQRDTVRILEPKVEYKYKSKTETVTILDSLVIHDTTEKLIFLPREYMVYKDTNYRAVVSGVEPRLDSLEIYQRNIVQTITKTVKVPDKKRWGIGVNVGAGWNGKEVAPYVGLGVQYNIIRW